MASPTPHMLSSKHEKTKIYCSPMADKLQNGEDTSFNDRIMTYAEKMKVWLEQEKPWLNPDFKLGDIAMVFAINRTYISRIFNEGFGASFSRVIQNLRVKEAERLIRTRPDLQMNQIADMSGFKSGSTFNRRYCFFECV